MGLEAACTVRIGRKSSHGKALLESELLLFRAGAGAGADSPGPDSGGNGGAAGGERLEIRFDQIREVSVDGESLLVRTDDQEARFELGESTAQRWARLIKEPKELFEKLELGPEAKVVAIDVQDPVFLMALRDRTAGVVEGRVPAGASVIFFGAESRDALRKLSLLRARMVDTGTIWVIRPKGSKAIAESDVFDALREAGLVDTKVVAFSRTHTAHKSVVPVELRGQGLRRRPAIVTLPPPPPGAGDAGIAKGKDAKKKAAPRAKAR
jgi:hypothetical protein